MKDLKKFCLYLCLIGVGHGIAMGLWLNAILCALYPIVVWKDIDHI